MRFTKDGRFYRVSRITGPSHNLLGLSFSRVEPAQIAMLKLREPEAGTRLDEQQIRQAVLTGVRQANASLGTAYHVDAIQYVPNDTPNPGVYSFLAQSLVESLAESGVLSADGSDEADDAATDAHRAESGPIAIPRERSRVPDGH